MSRRGRPRATAASDRYSRATTAASTSNPAVSQPTTSPKFDLRNPNTLAPTAATDEDYDAETAAILNLDEISGQSRGVKRNAVNLDGYDSDSSNEGFKGTRGKEKKSAAGADNKADAAGNDEDDDMFGGADSGEEDAIAQAENVMNGKGKGKKQVKFLELHEIDGQEKGYKKDGSMESSDDEDEDDDEEEEEEEIDPEIGAGGKKKHAPRMDNFNMKSEMEEGKFDDQGNYVRKAADVDAVHDTWLEGMSKKDIKKAKEAHEKREHEAKRRRLEEDELITGDIVSDLILLLERGETALEALARLNTNKKQTKPKKSWQHRKKPNDMDVDNTAATAGSTKETEDPKETARKEMIEKITTAADRLLSRGYNEIYDEPREALTRIYRKETSEPWVEPVKANVDGDDEEGVDSKVQLDQWEYRWSDGQGDGQIHGPYAATEMKAWRQAGYFQEGVVFRRLGESEADWTRLPEF